jgi:hypothetical protein
MALLTDGNPNDTPALQVYEMGILGVANVEGIDLSVKLGLATVELSAIILDVLLDHAWTPDPQTNIRRRTGVSDVVVSPQMTRWHALHTLAIVYRDAFNNQLNDRYQPKWNEYRALSRNAQEETMRFGIGLALTPIPQAPSPVFSVVPGANPDTIYYVQATWVSLNGQEGAPSELTTYETPAGSTLVVGTTNAPAVATGFNVYIGLSPATLALQNSTPIPIGVNFTLPGSGLVSGNSPGNGQLADIYIIGGRTLRRG